MSLPCEACRAGLSRGSLRGVRGAISCHMEVLHPHPREHTCQCLSDMASVRTATPPPRTPPEPALGSSVSG